MANTTTIEVWVLVDDSGDYAVGRDDDAVVEAYANEIQEVFQAGGIRRIKVTLTVTLPEVVELVAEVPHQGPATLTAAA